MSEPTPEKQLGIPATSSVIAIGSICVLSGIVSLFVFLSFPEKEANNFISIRPLTGLALFVAGAGFLLTTIRRKDLALGCAFLVALIGLFDGVQIISGFPIPIENIVGADPKLFHGPLAFSIAIFTAGISFLIGTGKNRTRRAISGVFSIISTAIGFSAIAISTYSTLAGVNSYGYEHSLITGTVIFLMGLLLSHWSGRGRSYKTSFDFVPAFALFLCISTTIGARQYSCINQHEFLKEQTAVGTETLSKIVTTRFKTHFDAVERMAARWTEDEKHSVSVAKKDAVRYVNDYANFQSIIWLKPDLKVLWIASSEESKQTKQLLESIKFHGENGLFKGLNRRGSTLVSTPLDVKPGKKGLIAITPVGDEGARIGYLASVFDFDQMISGVAQKGVWRDYAISIQDIDTTVYENHGEDTQGKELFTTSKTINLEGRQLGLSLYPRNDVVQELATNDNLILVAGLLISILISGSMLLAISSRKKKQRLSEINRQLRETEESKIDAEKRLRESSSFSQAMLSGADSAIITTDTSGNIVSLNAEGETLLGLDSIGDQTGANITEYLFASDVDPSIHSSTDISLRNEERFALLLRRSKDGSLDSSWIVIRADGERIPTLVSITPIGGDESDADGFLIVVRDISRLVAIDSELHELQTRFHAFLNNAPFLAYLKDEKGRYVYSNEQFENTFGMEPGEMLGKTVFDIVPEKVARDVSLHEKEVADTMRPASRIEELNGVDDIQGHYLFSRFPIELPEGRMFIGVVAIDVTSQVEIEAELREANRIAIESSKLKSEFLANMSHEIRTPMNGILGMTEVLLETELTKSQREFAEIVHESADALLRIINDILDFSKVEAGRMSVENVGFDLNTLVENTMTVVSESKLSKSVELIKIIDTGVKSDLFGDEGRIRQVLTNFLSNAVKFTEEGTILVNVSLVNEIDGNQTLRFSVKDTGIGISEEAKTKLFAPFVQGDGSLDRKFGGTGLGLSISKRITEALGGEIGFESELGKGSEFWFSIPLKPLENSGSEKYDIRYDSLTGVVVDEIDLRRHSLVRELEGFGVKAQGVRNPQKAIALCTSKAEAGKPFDLALISSKLHGLNGIELIELLKNNPQTRKMETILVHDGSNSDEAKLAQEKGALSCLSKPVRRLDLLAVLEMIRPSRRQDSRNGNRIDELLFSSAEQDANGSNNASELVVTAISDRRLKTRLEMKLELIGYKPLPVETVLEFEQALRNPEVIAAIVGDSFDNHSLPKLLKRSEISSRKIKMFLGVRENEKSTSSANSNNKLDGLVYSDINDVELSELLRKEIERGNGFEAVRQDHVSPDSLDESFLGVFEFFSSVEEQVGVEIAVMAVDLFLDETIRAFEDLAATNVPKEKSEAWNKIEMAYEDIGAQILIERTIAGSEENDPDSLLKTLEPQHKELLKILNELKERHAHAGS